MTSGNQRYYRIMNTSVSLKSEIPEYVVGERILDVGSGGGVMLDALEKKFGDSKTIIGTEISPIASKNSRCRCMPHFFRRTLFL